MKLLQRNPSAKSESGSAYVIALFVILLLTMLGLSLAFVTTTESQIGSNEELVEQAFFAADAGVGIAAANLLVTKGATDPCEVYLRDSTFVLERDVGSLTQVESTVLQTLPISRAPCSYCEDNLTTGYGDENYVRGRILVTAQGRVGGIRIRGDDTATTVAEQTVSAVVDVQPFQMTIDIISVLERCDNNENRAELFAD